jgi:hypothetical protein
MHELIGAMGMFPLRPETNGLYASVAVEAAIGATRSFDEQLGLRA